MASASIDKRPTGKKRWRVRWREHKRGPQKTRHFERKPDAEHFLDVIRGQLAEDRFVDPSAGQVSFRQYAEQWRATRLHRDGTATSVEQQLRLHVYPVIGDRPIASIRQSAIQGLVRQLSDRLAPSTVGVVYSRVAAVFNAAARDRVISSTPCVEVKRPETTSKVKPLTTEQVLAIATEIPERYRALVLAGAGTGLRPSELFGLAADRVRFLERVVEVDQQLVRVRAGDDTPDDAPRVALAPLKTKASYRTVPLPMTLAENLAAHLAQWPANSDLGLVFTNERGAPIQQQPFAAVWEAARARAGLPEWATPKDLRHFYASLLIRSGASVKAVQARLGHGSARTTLDTYSHIWPDEEDRTRRAVDEAFAPGRGLGSIPPEDHLRTATAG